MRDRRGQPAGRGQLLRFEDLLLDAPPFQLAQAGQIMEHGDDCLHLAERIEDRAGVHGHRQHLFAGRVLQLKLGVDDLGRLEEQAGDERRQFGVVRGEDIGV